MYRIALDFAGPGLAESVPDPGDDLVLFGGQRPPRRDSGFAQALVRVSRVRQRVELDQHVHWQRCPFRDTAYEGRKRLFDHLVGAG